MTDRVKADGWPYTGIPLWTGILCLTAMFVLPDIFGGSLSYLWMKYPGLDKPAHFVAFFGVTLIGYGVLLSLAWPVTDRGRLIGALALSLFISVLDEAQQAVVGHGRTAEVGDLVSDAAGAMMALTAISIGRLGLHRSILIAAVLVMPVIAASSYTYNQRQHYHRGMMYERSHDYQHARYEYQMALDGGLRTPGLYNSIAWLDVEFLDGDPVQAGAYVTQALAMDPDNPDIIETYGWILVLQGRSSEGVTHLERAKALKPTIYCIDLHLGVAYLNIGSFERALQHLQSQIQRNPADRFAASARKVLSSRLTHRGGEPQ
jgi:Tfp pilus assembly protein PilF